MMTDKPTVWPPLTAENRPWTRWWWMGSALTEAEITRHLELFQAAGLGGVEISPIYGPAGSEERFVSFLSPRWIALFAHTLREAQRLSLGVDLIAGTGWPFGGPQVSESDSACVAWTETTPNDAPPVSEKQLNATPLATHIGDDTRTTLFLAPTGQQVKRAAPSGAGNVLDHFSADAVRRYLEPFDAAFAALPSDLAPRCFFNDSWEVFGANATTDILAEFARQRGYDLRDYLPALDGQGDEETVSRVRSDYRETIGDLTRNAFLATFTSWAQERGAKVRNQSHGSPANLLDLYAAADIPETEIFGPPRLGLGSLESLAPLPPDFGGEEEALACRMASSAAHVAGRPLCSSESFTWLGDHGRVPLAHMKAEVDTLFTLGINHLFFHGTPFSPADVEWPGWLFYATTHCAPTNPFWRDLPALNAYIAACQSLLQEGTPDSDVLLYFPYYDLLASDTGTTNLLHFLTVHKTNTWLRDCLPGFTTAANTLLKRGWAIDFVSDKQIAEMVTVLPDGRLQTRSGATYRALVIAGCERMPPETLETIAALAGQGATVLVQDDLPRNIPGRNAVPERLVRLQAARTALKRKVTLGPEITALMEQAGIGRETLADAGLEFVRRRSGDDFTYFIANPGSEDVSGWFTLACPSISVVLLDPMTGTVGDAAVRTTSEGSRQVYLELLAGASLLLRTKTEPSASEIGDWLYSGTSMQKALPLTGDWAVEFVEGGPTLPATRIVTALSDWTHWGTDEQDRAELQAFSGMARYTLTFDCPDTTELAGWLLDLGTIYDSARIRLNGRDVGTVFTRPWQIRIAPELLTPDNNTLEIEVTNLMANRLADLERRKGDSWRPFLMVNIHYKPFDAANWNPVRSGLVGPVTLTPLCGVKPDS